ncbi:hypothetical protein [Cyanobium sp. WAJ14-Wanaka]|uniref:hypothetical protein n=1 Tax=Cyanobium sp. WAJ14-Wanaka TaxID=2823725 RepID=UPI0020CB6C7D|nr:hypothetical protein [Cyanobium sp. WAJ14-Wanaka]MCP9776206.1 hypothetical protein [Cyanobium sp. WAJ14-Wanaka]
MTAFRDLEQQAAVVAVLLEMAQLDDDELVELLDVWAPSPQSRSQYQRQQWRQRWRQWIDGAGDSWPTQELPTSEPPDDAHDALLAWCRRT